MAEMRIDKAADEITHLKAIIRLMLTTSGELKGRALAEQAVGDYRQPIESVCEYCGTKYVGVSCPRQGCR